MFQGNGFQSTGFQIGAAIAGAIAAVIDYIVTFRRRRR